MYLSIPMRLVRFLGVDTNSVLRTAPYIAHLPLVLLTDYFLWKTFKKIVHRDAAKLSFLLHFVNKFQTMYMIRTLTNSLEQTFTVVAFYFYLDQKNKFTINTAVMTALITISFMIRTTSPTGWIPLLAYKVLKESSFVPFAIAGIVVALPIICLCILVDTHMYSSETWVISGYNFYKVNIELGLSKTFGMDDFWYYWRVVIPVALTVLFPYTYAGMANHYKA